MECFNHSVGVSLIRTKVESQDYRLTWQCFALWQCCAIMFYKCFVSWTFSAFCFSFYATLSIDGYCYKYVAPRILVLLILIMSMTLSFFPGLVGCMTAKWNTFVLNAIIFIVIDWIPFKRDTVIFQDWCRHITDTQIQEYLALS